MTLARNDVTKKLDRHNRFIIDDPESSVKLAYALTKPLKLGWTFNNQGVYKFVLQEVVSTDNDFLEENIADYYKFFPKPTEFTQPEATEEQTTEENTNQGRKTWL